MYLSTSHNFFFDDMISEKNLADCILLFLIFLLLILYYYHTVQERSKLNTYLHKREKIRLKNKKKKQTLSNNNNTLSNNTLSNNTLSNNNNTSTNIAQNETITKYNINIDYRTKYDETKYNTEYNKYITYNQDCNQGEWTLVQRRTSSWC